MKKNIKHPLILLFLLITLISAFIFVPYIIGDKAFIVGWDMQTIYDSNFENLRTVLQDWVNNGTKPFWTWYSYLGNDFYSSKLFYFNDFFEWPFALTNISYENAIMIMSYIKLLIAGFGFYAYSHYNRYSSFTCLVGSIIFTFSSYILYVIPHPFFASFFVFLPLYFLSVDRYIKEKKKYMFIFMVFFMFLNNYYQFYSLSLFTIMYYIWRWEKEYHSFKNMMKEAFKLIGYYLVGMLLSCFALIPEALNILGNTRVGSRSSTFVFESVIPYLEYIFGLILPASALAERGTAISHLFKYVTSKDSVMIVYLWSSSIVTLLFPQLFTKKNKGKFTILYPIIVSVFALIPILSSAMHGFSEPSFRWLASPIYLLIVSILPLIEDPSRIDQKLLKISMVTIAILMALATPISAIISGYGLDNLGNEVYLPILFIPTFVIIGICIYKNKKKAMLIALTIELCLVSYMSFYGSPALASMNDADYERESYLMGAKNEYTNFTLTLDENNINEFYRNYIDPINVYWGVSTSYNLDFNIMGLLAYDSTYLPSLSDMITLDQEHVQHYLPWTFNIQNSNIMTLVSTKYAVVMNEEDVPFTNYQFVANYYSMKVYENLDYYNLGKTYNQIMTYDEYDSSMSNLVTSVVIAHSEDEEEIESLLGNEIVTIDTVHKESNYLFADITTTEKGFVIISVPYDKGWSTKVNGKIVKTYSVNGGLTGIPLEEGYNSIEMNFTPHGLKEGIYASMAGVVILAIIVLYDGIKKKNKNL